MRRGGIAAAAVGVGLLALGALRPRGVPAPSPESESEIPAEAAEPPPRLVRMATLAGRPRPPPSARDEVDAAVEGGAAPAAAAAAGGAPAGVGVLVPAADAALAPPVFRTPDALLPERRPDADPPWPLFTDDEAGRRHAMRRGLRAAARLPRLSTEGAVWAADRIRRDLTEGLFLPETADPGTRAALEARIAALNDVVYRHSRALEGVTEIVVAARGDYPYRLVAERPFGSNTVLFWNRRGSLDPRRMPAGEPLVLPLEPLVLVADRDTRALHLLLGDAWIREFAIGVGADRTPTPAGRFAVGRTLIDRRLSRPADALGPLGSAWIGTYALEFRGGRARTSGRGPSLHGTDRPESIGLAESDGSIRLRDADASELLRWVDTRDGARPRLYVR